MHVPPARSRAFTLIELLIVVAIISILAAIAVPNFQQAMIRAKVARAENDLRSIATALESYRMENPNYPPENYLSPLLEPTAPGGVGLPNHIRLMPVTTPVAYLSSLPRDPFASIEDDLNHIWPPTYHYAAANDPLNPGEIVFYRGKNPEGRHFEWICQGNGPDRTPHSWQYPRYDPTNGTSSEGNILRVGP